MGTTNEARGARNAPASSGTLYAAVEVSRKRWVVAIHAPDAGEVGLHAIPAADTAALAGLMDRARDAVQREHGLRPRVLCGYEAGYERASGSPAGSPGSGSKRSCSTPRACRRTAGRSGSRRTGWTRRGCSGR